MSHAWDTYHRRTAALHALVETAERTGEHREPWTRSNAVWDEFDSEEQILKELHHHWNTALAGAVSLAIEDGEDDLQDDVLRAYRAVVNRHRGIRKVLEANAQHPALAPLLRREKAMLAQAAGVVADRLVLPSTDSVPLPGLRKGHWWEKIIGEPAPQRA